MRTVAVVLAGGSGSRFGARTPKQLQVLRGRTLLAHCAVAFDRAPGVDELLVVIAAEFAPDARNDLTGLAKLTAVINGGDSRTESARRAISWLAERASASDDRPQDCNILFHDAARPLVDQRIIADCVSALGQWQAVGVVVPSSDTIAEVADGGLLRILPRDSLARCQTPQGFRLSVISRAYQLADADPDFAAAPPTDDCGVVLRYLPDLPVGAVTGSERNLKVTYAGDLVIAQALLELGEPAS